MMNHSYVVTWYGNPIKLSWLASSADVDTMKVTSSHGYCFYNKKLLVIVNQRGCELPGGHRENGETAEACLEREVFEEAYVRLKNLSLIGYLEVDNSINDNWAADSGYPIIGYMAFFKARVISLNKFAGEFETKSRKLIEARDLPKLHHEWLPIYDTSLELALL